MNLSKLNCMKNIVLPSLIFLICVLILSFLSQIVFWIFSLFNINITIKVCIIIISIFVTRTIYIKYLQNNVNNKNIPIDK